MIKTIILDFDGTLGNTKGIILRTMQATLRKMNLPERTDAQCSAMIGLPLKQCFTQLYPDHETTVVDDATGDACAETYRRLFDEYNLPGTVPLFPNVKETLGRLHEAGIRLTVASSRSHQTLDSYVSDLGLRAYIKYIIGVEDVEDAKPGPGPVLKTISDFGLKKEECLVVGDTAYDILMAHRAGVKAVGVTYGNGLRRELEDAGAEWLIDDFAELEEICKNAVD